MELKEKGDIGAYLSKHTKAVEGGNLISMLIMGEHLHNGDFGLEVDDETAFQLWLPPADEGVLEAMPHVGLVYFMGEGVERDISKAIDYLLLIVDKKYAEIRCKMKLHKVQN